VKRTALEQQSHVANHWWCIQMRLLWRISLNIMYRFLNFFDLVDFNQTPFALVFVIVFVTMSIF